MKLTRPRPQEHLRRCSPQLPQLAQIQTIPLPNRRPTSSRLWCLCHRSRLLRVGLQIRLRQHQVLHCRRRRHIRLAQWLSYLLDVKCRKGHCVSREDAFGRTSKLSVYTCEENMYQLTTCRSQSALALRRTTRRITSTLLPNRRPANRNPLRSPNRLPHGLTRQVVLFPSRSRNSWRLRYLRLANRTLAKSSLLHRTC